MFLTRFGSRSFPRALARFPSLPFRAASTCEFQCSGSPELMTKPDMIEREVALLDAFICGFQRSTTLFFGRIVSNPSDLPLFKDWLGYSLTYNGVPYTHGNAMHLHNSVEIFVALDGDFEIGYCNPGCTDNFKSSENPNIYSTVLKPFDMIACPAGVFHYYKNVDASKKDKQILTILPGCPSVQWAPEVVYRAREKGAVCDDVGVLNNGVDKNGKHKSQNAPFRAPEAGLENGTLDDFVVRYSGQTSAMKLSGPILNQEGALDGSGAKSWLTIDYETMAKNAMFQVTETEGDVLVIVLKGKLQLDSDWSGKQILGEFDMVKLPKTRAKEAFMKSESESSLLMVVKSNLPHSFDFFFDPCEGGQLKRK